MINPNTLKVGDVIRHMGVTYRIKSIFAGNVVMVTRDGYVSYVPVSNKFWWAQAVKI